MGGGLMQLVAYGAQDVYLSGNPQITFFKVVYRRHTNFSVEPIQQTWNGAADFGRTVTCNINRNGDLITNMYVAVSLNEVAPGEQQWGYVNRLGHAMLDSCKIEIGGSKIDEQYGEWLNVWYELTHKVGQERGYAKMIGDVANLTEVSNTGKRAYQMYVPLQFWFNRNNGLALPLIALQYHDVRVTLTFRKALDCVNWVGNTQPALSNLMQDSYLLIDYVYLDSEERKRFAQASHEYLIEQLQFTGSEGLSGSSNRYRLNFNHPSKYLIWVPKLQLYKNRHRWVSHAFDNNWAAAKDRFAKLVIVASRAGVEKIDSEGYEITVTGSAAAVGDLFEGTLSGDVSGNQFGTILSKVDVKLVAQAPASGGKVLVAQGNSEQELLNDLLNNAIVVRNDITMEDMTRTFETLVGLGLNSQVLELSLYNVVNYHNYGNFVDGSDNPVVSAKLQLNGHDRFQARDGNYFNYVQPFQHFSNTPCDGVNVYSFALKAEDYQPTGTCNFSRIDNATLQVDCGQYNAPGNGAYVSEFVGSNKDSSLNIYTMNYNVLRVMSGMAGCAYSN
jgi:hypothetical protein